MELYYAVFKHVCEEPTMPHLIGFFNVDGGQDIETQIKSQFERVFEDKYGEHGRSFELHEHGKVEPGKGYEIEELSYDPLRGLSRT